MIAGVRLQELDVVLTDLLWSGVSLWCFVRLTGVRHTLSTAGEWFRWFFLLMSVAVLLGAFLGHGFQYALGYEAKYPGWIVSMWGVACLERASIAYAGERVSERLARIMSVANVTELVVFHGLILYFGYFKLVEAHAAYGLIVIAVPLHGRVYRATGSAASRLVLWGIGIAALALGVEALDLGLGVWFNYHDVSHVILTASTLLYYRAARRMTRGRRGLGVGSPPPRRPEGLRAG